MLFFHSHTEPKFKCQLCCKTRPDFSGKLGGPALLQLQKHTFKVKTHPFVLGVTANFALAEWEPYVSKDAASSAPGARPLAPVLLLVWDWFSINTAGLSSTEVYLRNEGPSFQPGACHLNVSSWGKAVGGGRRMGNPCTPVADACWCMAKPIL